MQQYDKGQVIIPTGGGKTMCMIADTKVQHQPISSGTHLSHLPHTTVVVAPRILLAVQLCEEFMEMIDGSYTHVMHVHSGETHHFSTTNIEKIHLFAGCARTAGENVIIFTTYNSLQRIVEADIEVNTIYFDEAHNSVRRDWFPAVEYFSNEADRCYFFTATPKHSNVFHKPGMNDTAVYGQVICNVPAPELVNNGYILRPTINAYEVDIERQKGVHARDDDRSTLLDMVDGLDDSINHKILVAAPTSKVMWSMLAGTAIIDDLNERGYDVLHITSKYGAYLNKTKVNREKFFDTFNDWGKDPDRKFVIFHYSILSEGINVHGLTHTIFLRQLDVIQMAQTVGRVIRLHRDDSADIQSGKITAGVTSMYRKPTGFVTVPVFKNYGKQTISRLENLVETIFDKGMPATSVVNR